MTIEQPKDKPVTTTEEPTEKPSLAPTEKAALILRTARMRLADHKRWELEALFADVTKYLGTEKGEKRKRLRRYLFEDTEALAAYDELDQGLCRALEALGDTPI